jgi:ribosomal protein L40E
VRTGDLRWGYTGTGAHDLSSVLLADILAGHRELRCPDCFGVSPLAADMIRCRSCHNTGLRPGTRQAEDHLLTEVIANLPEEFERTRLEFLHAITGKQPAESDISAARRTIRDIKSSIAGQLARIRHTSLPIICS